MGPVVPPVASGVELTDGRLKKCVASSRWPYGDSGVIVYCSSGARGRYLYIYIDWEAWINICEVAIGATGVW